MATTHLYYFIAWLNSGDDTRLWKLIIINEDVHWIVYNDNKFRFLGMMSSTDIVNSNYEFQEHIALSQCVREPTSYVET